MKHRNKISLLLLLVIAQLQAPTAKNASQSRSSIELETLRIKGFIYEPEVLIILEQPSIDLITIEEQKRHDFLEDFDKPLKDFLY